jgi:hypothetical protein
MEGMLPGSGAGAFGGRGDPSPEQLLSMLEELQRQGHSLDEISPDLGVGVAFPLLTICASRLTDPSNKEQSGHARLQRACSACATTACMHGCAWTHHRATTAAALHMHACLGAHEECEEGKGPEDRERPAY